MSRSPRILQHLSPSSKRQESLKVLVCRRLSFRLQESCYRCHNRPPLDRPGSGRALPGAVIGLIYSEVDWGWPALPV